MPFTTSAARSVRTVGIEALVVHVPVAGSAASTGARQLITTLPPTASRMPFTTPVASPVRGVGIGALVVQTPGPTAARKLGGLRRDTTRDSGSSQLAANARRRAIGTNHGRPVHIVHLNRSRVLSRMWHTCRRDRKSTRLNSSH